MQKLRGFTRSFWVANTLELFERFAYYGSKAILAVFVADRVGLGPEKAGWLVGSLFNGLLYFLPILAGTIVDRYGFKKSLLACFSIFCVGYFLIGLGGLPAGKPLVDALGAETYMILALLVTAVGGSLIKPSIVGTVARICSALGHGPVALLHVAGFGWSLGFLIFAAAYWQVLTGPRLGAKAASARLYRPMPSSWASTSARWTWPSWQATPGRSRQHGNGPDAQAGAPGNRPPCSWRRALRSTSSSSAIRPTFSSGRRNMRADSDFSDRNP